MQVQCAGVRRSLRCTGSFTGDATPVCNRMSLLCQVSSVELERVVIASVPAVIEAAAVGVTPPAGGAEQLVMFLVLHQTGNTAAATAQASHKREDQNDGALGSQTSTVQMGQPGPEGVQDTEDDPAQGRVGHQPQAVASVSHAHDTGQDVKATDVGIGPNLDGLWDAVARAKSAAVSAASRVTDLAVAAVQSAPTKSIAQAESNETELQQLKLQCQQAIRTSLNPLFKLERVLVRESLPRTASNKVMRRVLRDELRLASAKL